MLENRVDQAIAEHQTMGLLQVLKYLITVVDIAEVNSRRDAYRQSDQHHCCKSDRPGLPRGHDLPHAVIRRNYGSPAAFITDSVALMKRLGQRCRDWEESAAVRQGCVCQSVGSLAVWPGRPAARGCRPAATSQPSSQISPPGRPVAISAKPIITEAASAGSGATPKAPRATTNAASRTPQPASDTGTNCTKLTGGMTIAHTATERCTPTAAPTSLKASIESPIETADRPRIIGLRRGSSDRRRASRASSASGAARRSRRSGHGSRSAANSAARASAATANSSVVLTRAARPGRTASSPGNDAA